MKNKTNNKIILVYPTNPDPPPTYFGPPYGIALIAAVLEKQKRPVRPLDFSLTAEIDMQNELKRILIKEKPKYIGINIQSATRGAVYRLIDIIKKIDDKIIIILGGPFASLEHDILLKFFPVDYVVIGEGEQTLSELLNSLDKNKKDLDSVRGIAFISGGKVFLTEKREPISNLDDLPYPAFYLFSGFDKTINKKEKFILPDFFLGKRCTTIKNSLMLLSSRDCLYGCNFCPMSSALKGGYRSHSPEYFVDMLEYFNKKYKIRKFIFGDNFFTCERKRVIKICKLIIKRKLKIKWGCMTRSDYVDSESLKLMSRAGCYEISYGVESGSKKIQKIIGKNLNLKKTKEAFYLTKIAGIKSILMLMVGNLGETKKTIEESLQFIKDIEPDNVLVQTTKIYPGTKIYSMMVNKGLISKIQNLTDDFHAPIFNLEHTEKELKDLKDMIGQRRVFIEIDREKREKKTSLIKKELIFAAQRSESIVFFGKEPVLHKNFFDILNFAGSIPIHNINVETEGAIFLQDNLIKKLVNLKDLRSITLSIAGYNDELVQFQEILPDIIRRIELIKNLRPDFLFKVRMYVKKENIALIYKIMDYICELGFFEINIVFLDNCLQKRRASKQLNSQIKEISASARKLIQRACKNSSNYYISGAPFCILPRRTRIVYYFFDEIIDINGIILNSQKERLKLKTKLSSCNYCDKNELCEGFLKRYPIKLDYLKY